jgi:hypothetical protein
VVKPSGVLATGEAGKGGRNKCRFFAEFTLSAANGLRMTDAPHPRRTVGSKQRRRRSPKGSGQAPTGATEEILTQTPWGEG